jgi:hypothetical protein
MGDTWWVIIICPCVNVFSLMGGVTEADVGFPTARLFFLYLCKAEYFFVANAVTDYLISFPSKS